MADYVAPDFEPIGPLKSFRGVPRFGHSSNITDIFSDDGIIDTSKITDYVMGSIFIAAFLLSTYILFIFMVVVLKLCFGSKAGILAGFPFVEDKSLVFDKPRKNNYFRGFILILIFSVISGGVVFLTKGTQQVRNVVSDVRDATEGFSHVSKKVVDTANLMIKFGEDSVPIRDNLSDVIDEGLCKSFEGGNANPEEDFDRAAASAVDILGQLQDFARDELTDIRDTFANDIMDVVTQTTNTTDTTEIFANPAYYAIPTITLGVLLFFGLMLAWFEVNIPVFFCVQTWFFLPLFFILIFVSIAVIAAIGAVLVANSDFCIGNPEGAPEGTLRHIFALFDFDEKTSAAVDYYILDGCRSEYEQLTVVKDLIVYLDEGTQAITDMGQLLSANKAEFETLCGGQPGSLDPLEETIALASASFDDVMQIGNSATDLLNCQDINSIWIDIVHDAMCTSAPSAFTWMFSSVTAIYASGIFIYLLRGALLPTVDVKDLGPHDDYDDDSAYSDDDYS